MSKFTTPFYIFTIIIIISFFHSCIERPDDNMDILSESDKKTIGITIDTALVSYYTNNSNTTILDESSHPEIYSYINQLKNKIANTPYIQKAPTIRIINDQLNHKNAFVTPDCHIYIYTSLLKTLDYESQLVGVLSCLMACSDSEKALKKLEDKFSTSYLIDLALGTKLNDVSPILAVLKNEPYDSLWVNTYDEKSINTLCSEGYNIRGYSDLFSLQPNIEWMHLFPRSSTFAATLFNRNNGTDCSGTVDNATVYNNVMSQLPQ